MTERCEGSQPILEMHGISKRFPGVLALDEAELCIAQGEIHSLIGQNGAGKSTLMKILAGVYTADEGTIQLDGQPVNFRHPREALRKGIVTVYQELSLLPNLTVAENIFLGREPGNTLVIDNKFVYKRALSILSELGIEDIDINTRVSELALAQKQLVEIAKALSHELKVLVLDEPTAPLTNEDTEHLFRILQRIREKGVSIIFITHRLKEVLKYCDRGTILRNGCTIKTVRIQEVCEDDLIELMIGQELETFYRSDGRQDTDDREVILDVKNLSVGQKVKDVSFEVYRGEIVGITGLLGAGQNELARALFGIQAGSFGAIQRSGRPIKIASPKDAVRHGICLMTENRKEEGLVLEMSVKENISLPSLAKFRLSNLVPLINNLLERRSIEEYIHKVDIKLRSQNSRIRTLSGGNQQKSIVARWLLRNLDILIFIEPTRGIDVGAKAEIYRLLNSLAGEGKAIVVVSTDHTEILGISDRIFLMYKGRLRSVLKKAEVTEEMLLSEIQGGSSHE